MDDQQRARELLAQEYARRGLHQSAKDILANHMDEHLGWVREANMALAAIAAALRAAPEGYVLVPVEPTPEMLQAACECGAYPGMNDWWRAMLAARPQGLKDA